MHVGGCESAEYSRAGLSGRGGRECHHSCLMQHVDDVAHKSESLSLSERLLPSLAVCSASLNVVFLVFHPVSLLSSC